MPNQSTPVPQQDTTAPALSMWSLQALMNLLNGRVGEQNEKARLVPP
jgi:hypothetical protein